ncbi:hypothetical protein MOX01_20520 [Microbacterium oxydans]|nr:hypothetical protein MOX01_20520 [Microbacterium oxydans]
MRARVIEGTEPALIRPFWALLARYTVPNEPKRGLPLLHVIARREQSDGPADATARPSEADRKDRPMHDITDARKADR